MINSLKIYFKSTILILFFTTFAMPASSTSNLGNADKKHLNIAYIITHKHIFDNAYLQCAQLWTEENTNALCTDFENEIFIRAKSDNVQNLSSIADEKFQNIAKIYVYVRNEIDFDRIAIDENPANKRKTEINRLIKEFLGVK